MDSCPGLNTSGFNHVKISSRNRLAEREQKFTLTKIEGLETGCLLADAGRLSEFTCSLNLIESSCWPWHFIFNPDLVQLKGVDAKTGLKLPSSLVWDGPNIRDLNEDKRRNFNSVGVRKNSTLDLQQLTVDSDSRLTTAYKTPMLTEVSEGRLTTETDRTNRIKNGVKGRVVIDLRSLEP